VGEHAVAVVVKVTDAPTVACPDGDATVEAEVQAGEVVSENHLAL